MKHLIKSFKQLLAKLSSYFRKKPKPKYPNLASQLIPTGPNQLWLSQETYLKLPRGGYLYISLIIDAYNNKILGHHITKSPGSTVALQRALSTLDHTEPLNLIHHTTGNTQYCNSTYLNLLNIWDIKVSWA